MTGSLFYQKEKIIIRNEMPLLEAFVPEEIMHRDGQKQQVASCLQPAIQNMKTRNSFIHGPCGTGKTLLVQWILNELKQHCDAKTAYINCWKRNTTHAVLQDLFSQINIFTNYRQSVSEMMEKLERFMKENQLIICLDEVDMLSESSLLYDLARSGAGLVMISNDQYALMNLDSRIKSSISSEQIEFPAYKVSEISDILKQRIQFALVPGAIKQKDIDLIAEMSIGDVRIGIETLRKAALLAEQQDSEKITKEHIQQSFSDTKNFRKSEALKILNPHERSLYLILGKHGELKSKELYSKYVTEVDEPATDRSYRNYMSNLSRLGLVEQEGELTGRRYRIV